jgi:hypothetical protein
MKRNILLVVLAVVFAFAVSYGFIGCKKAEQPAAPVVEQPAPPAEQPAAPAAPAAEKAPAAKAPAAKK